MKGVVRVAFKVDNFKCVGRHHFFPHAAFTFMSDKFLSYFVQLVGIWGDFAATFTTIRISL